MICNEWNRDWLPCKGQTLQLAASKALRTLRAI
jgi:hypothetical protein